MAITYTINGTREKDRLTGYNDGNNIINGYEGDDTIKGGKLDDVIDGGRGDDNISGGTGKNYIQIYTKQSFGADTISLTKKENLYLQLADVYDDEDAAEYLDIQVDGKTLVISVFSQKGYDAEGIHNGKYMGKVSIKNYTKKDVLTSDGSFLIVDNNGETIYDMRSEFKLSTFMDANNYTKSSFTGTWIDDYVDARGYVVYKKGVAITDKNTDEETLAKTKGVSIKTGGASNYNEVYGSMYADTIIGGNDNDVIIGGPGNDSIKGGKGSTTVVYSIGDGDDVITLTKGENIAIRLEDLDLNDLDFSYTNKNKDFVLSYSVLDDEGFTKEGSLTLKNFGAKDVTGADTNVILIVYNTTEDKYDRYDLKNAINEDGTYWYKLTANNDITASWLSSYIDASEATEKLDKKGNHVNIKLTGGNGDDYIVGSKYADTINGGKGDDEIYGGKGDDALNGGKGTNLFVFNNGDGDDIITSGKGVDTLRFANAENPKNYFDIKKDGRNLTITYYEDSKKETKGGSVTVQNYYLKNGKVDTTNSVKYVQFLFEGAYVTTPIESFVNRIKGTTDSTTNTKIFNGTEGDDVIVADGSKGTSIANIVYGNGGNDLIYGSSKVDNLYGGSGTDYIRGNDGNDIIYGGNGGNDELFGNKGNDLIVAGTKVDTESENTVNIGYNENQTFVLFNSEDTNINGGEGNDTIWGGYGNDIISGEKGDDEIHVLGGSNWVNGGENNDKIYGGIGNDEILGGSGNDEISGGGTTGEKTMSKYDGNLKKTFYFSDKLWGESGNDVIYSYQSGERDSNNESSVGIECGVGDDTVYAQSAENYIWNSEIGTFNSYIDNYTFIKDEDGVSFKRDGATIIDNDKLYVLNNSDESTEGAKDNLNIVFNVIANYDYDSSTPQSRMALGGDVFVLSDDELENWKNRKNQVAYKGIDIYQNSVENIYSSDGYYITSTDIAIAAETVSIWLTADGTGRDFADVNDVLSHGADEQITELMTVFEQNIHWTQVSS